MGSFIPHIFYQLSVTFYYHVFSQLDEHHFQNQISPIYELAYLEHKTSFYKQEI